MVSLIPPTLQEVYENLRAGEKILPDCALEERREGKKEEEEEENIYVGEKRTGRGR